MQSEKKRFGRSRMHPRQPGTHPPDRSIFSAASPELRAAIERTAVGVTLAPGEFLFSQGDDADSFYILDEGDIEIGVLSPGGRKLALEVMTPGEIFGEIGLFAGKRTASASAIGRARLRRVRRGDLLAAIRTEPDLALQFIDLLCERLRVVSEKLEERSFMPLPARLARRLLHLADKLAPTDGVIPVSQAALADFAGATREAVAKTLAVWRARGWVGLSRGVVQVRDKEALLLLAESADDF
jgi:CRP/FNR family transcriptional regulator, cyclic AMP receptor protein